MAKLFIYFLKLCIRLPIMLMVFIFSGIFLCISETILLMEVLFTWAFNAKSQLWEDVPYMWKDLWKAAWKRY